LRKLSYTGVWVPQARQPPRHGTSIIFDWDDTLLCTSYLSTSQQSPGGKTSDLLLAIAQAGRRLLETAQQLGQVFIVTNAMINWVDYSARKWVPELLPVLDGIQVISAREKYEARYPRTIGEWKLQTFLEVQRRLGSEAVTNFVSVGDSVFELEAATAIGRMFPQAIIKTVKFREEPTPKELLRELELMGSQLYDIVASGTGVRVAIESRSKGKSSRATGG
jgi:phosphoglycolate phosphatase-like HAD superfamily hydrolase